jgi:hypothetical protein
MSGLIGADSNGSSGSSSSEGTQALAAEPLPAGSGAGGAAVEEAGSESRGGKVRIWFAALLRSATALVLTLVILSILGVVADVVLHVTRHTSSHSTVFSGIDAVNVVLDGDVSLSVVGQSNGGSAATLAAVDTSTPFDDPSRSTSVIGGTLYVTERCPDSRCTSQLTLTINTNDQVNIVAGNALRLNDGVIDISGIDGQTNVQVAPGKLIVTDTIVTGAVIGMVECDTVVDCRGVVTAPGTDRGTSAVDG